MTSIHIAQAPGANAPIVEMNGAQPMPNFIGRPAENDANVLRRDVMNPVAAWFDYGERHFARHA